MRIFTFLSLFSLLVAVQAAPPQWTAEEKLAFGFESADFWKGGTVVSSPKKQGEHALLWEKHKENSSITWTSVPKDWSNCNLLSFWLHSNEATEQTFMIIIPSRGNPKINSYFSKKITVDWKGWKQLNFRFRDFGRARKPAGWNKITGFYFTASGWNQEPANDTTWILDDLQLSFTDKPYMPKLSGKKYLDAPKNEDFLKHLVPNHPRIIVTDARLAEIKTFIQTSDLGKKWYENTVKKADILYRRPVRKHELPDGRRLLSISRDVLNRLFHWGLLYRLDGDRKWLDRAMLEMEAVANFKDWNPSHWLDTAEMTHAMGLGYDWFYNDLTEAQRKIIRDGLWQHGLRLAYNAYMGLPAEGQQGWRRVTNNWNFVCNGGSALGAMAVLDEMPKECSLILNQSFRYIQIPITHFDPDGAWWEGLGYWGYSMRYFLAYLRGLETCFGTDFGFIEALKGHGFEQAGDFPIYLTAPGGGVFNFADSGSGRGYYKHWAFHYLAQRFHNPLYLQHQLAHTNGDVYDLIYYRPLPADIASKEAKLDKYFRKTEVATMRSSWTDKNATFTAIKSGRNGIAHSHQDLGSFLFYSLNEKWFIDPGTEGQTYQSHKHHLPHNHFYRIRAEGHNTLVFNPNAKYAQRHKAKSTITRFETSAKEVFAVVDLNDAYRDHATSVTRGYRLFDERRSLLVQDEITSDKENEIWWFAHSAPNTEFSLDETGTEATLERNGKLCTVRLLSPAGAVFTIMDARPLPTSPDPEIQNKNKNMRKLAIHLANAKNTTISVLFSARYEFEAKQNPAVEVSPIANWKLSADNAPRLDSLEIDGDPLPGFSPEVFTYSVEFPPDNQNLPTLKAKSKQGIATQTAASAFPGQSTIRVQNKGGASIYKVRFVEEVLPGSTEKKQVKPKNEVVNGITVSASLSDGNLPKNVLDGNLETRWSASSPEEWIAFDFGKTKKLATLKIAWYNGDKRTTAFNISTSTDGTTWKKIYSGNSSGKSAEPETVPLPADTASRHLKITAFGNSQNLWNSITEVEF